MKKNVLYLICVLLITLFYACKENKTGSATINFVFSVDNEKLTLHDKFYTNENGDTYKVDELKFFISDVYIVDNSGKIFPVLSDKSIHYVDLNIKKTLEWNLKDAIPAGDYKEFSFLFGLSDKNNINNFFVNPPESNMAWSPFLGGGYHYMQINGKWIDENSQMPLNVHTGITVDSDNSKLIHNCFRVDIKNCYFKICENKNINLILDMNINEWFKNPVTVSFQQWGSNIMADKDAQSVYKTNGQNDLFLLKAN